MIPYGRQHISAEDIEAVVRVLRSDYLTQGPMVQAFEKSVVDYCGASYAVAVNSATSALHMACLALGVETGDRVWTSPITFVASANCARYCGAEVDFVDIDPLSNNMSVDSLAEKLREAERRNELPKIVIPVHIGGLSCDMAGIYHLSQQYGFKIIEDASHAIGGTYLNVPVGRCQYSDITVFSFHPVKVITSGEGGMLMTNDVEISRRLGLLRSHGITRDTNEMLPQTADEVWQYQQVILGFNYRMTDIHAALGLSQMDKLDEFVAVRNEIAESYDLSLKNLPITLPFRQPNVCSAYHLYIIRVPRQDAGWGQKEILNILHSADIGASLHYIPVYRQPYYRKMGFKPGYCPQAERYFSEAISIPIYPDLRPDQQKYVVEVLKDALTKYNTLGLPLLKKSTKAQHS
jgi:UDP-4-amino-4,6-dideoxy-N-acetyl-beta-L-altrosamine transaminase